MSAWSKALELAGGEDVGQVEQGARDGGDGDVVDDGDVCVGEDRGAMNGEVWVGAGGAAGDGDLDPGVAVVAQFVQAGGGAVREDRAVAAGDDRGHVEPLALEEFFRDEGVDRVVDAVHAAGGYALVDRGGGQPELAQLVEPEHAVLLARELGEGLVEKPAVFSGFSRSLRHTRHAPRKRVTCLSRRVPIQR